MRARKRVPPAEKIYLPEFAQKLSKHVGL